MLGKLSFLCLGVFFSLVTQKCWNLLVQFGGDFICGESGFVF